MNWEALAAISAALTVVVIVATAIAGFVQIRQLQDQRRDSASVELVRTFQDGEFVRAFDLVMSLPVGLSADELRTRGTEFIQAARTVAIRLEMVGALVYRRTISFDVTEEVCGGATVSAWHRVKALVEAQRAEQDYPMYLEWFQWLAEQFEKGRYLNWEPAHVRERDWKRNV